MNRSDNEKFTSPTIALMAIIMSICFSPSTVLAVEVSGVRFNERYRSDGVNMELQGAALKTKFFIRAFVAGFYKEDLGNIEVLGDVPKRIEVEYFVDIPGRKLNKYTIDRMKDNVTLREFKNLEKEIDLMGQYFVDLKTGDRFSLTYIPQLGTKFEHNDILVGVIKGSEFARALFSVWIGERPFDHNLKKQILGTEEDFDRLVLKAGKEK